MKHKQSLFLVILMLILLVLPACGKKGRPFVPERRVLLEVKDLSVECENGTVFLSGKAVAVPGQSKSGSDIIGCRVYHCWYTFNKPPCEGCPIDYSGYKEIKRKVLAGKNFSCHVSIDRKKGIHFFEVRLLGRKGAVGPPSNRVKLTIEN